MKKINNLGFTLIELLAVITIMGILLIVGIPAISKTIFNSRKDVAETSVKSYTNEVNKEILSHEISDSEVIDGTYSIMKNGHICLAVYDNGSDTCSGEMLEVDMDGQVPESGEVEVFNKRVVDVYNAKVGNFYVNSKDTNYIASSEPEQIKKTICRTTGDTNYDPGTLYTCEVADGVKYDFRILSTSGDTVNLLMTSNLPGVLTSWFNWGTGNGANFNGCGPIQAYEALHAATSGWTKLKDVNFQYVNGDIRITFDESVDSYRVYSKHPECYDFEIYYDSMKARMPSYAELAALSSEWYTSNLSGIDGYWLNDPLTTSPIGSEFLAYTVGGPHVTGEEVMFGLGVRPVIQVSKSDLS